MFGLSKQGNQGRGLLKDIAEGLALLRLAPGRGQQVGLQRFGLLAGQHLFGHVYRKNQDALGLVLRVGQCPVDKVEVVQLGLAGG